MSFVWFWTFWHWSKESFRAGSLLRSPLHGIGGHWDEWFRHEVSESDRAAIASAGRTEASQRQFIGWLLLHWAREADLRANRLARHFVLGQLAQVQPFNQWAAFGRYRASYGVGGISAIVLSEDSPGRPDDVRLVEALALPADPAAPAVLAEGFQADSLELETPRRAAINLLCGDAFVVFLLFWLAGGQRPYPQWLRVLLGLGWFALGGLISYLLTGPEPGEKLYLLGATVAGLWCGLVLVAVTVAATQCVLAWRTGRRWRARLEQGQVRLRMNGGLTLKGGSAGLAFCLNTLLALARADARSAQRSWVWRRLVQKLRCGAQAWAATGVIAPDGYLKPVVLEPKLRACLQRHGIKHILTPRQPAAGRQVVERLAQALLPPRGTAAPTSPVSGEVRLGFAAEAQSLRVHPCAHLAQALMRLGEFNNTRQLALNGLAVLASLAMLLALPDLRGILRPPPAPIVVPPSSPAPDYLWVSLDTPHPEYFLVVLESRFWLNRRAEVSPRGGVNGSMRAEIRLQRLAGPSNNDLEDGVVWIERRHRFLFREFATGERVGRYDLAYLNRMGHE